MTVTSQAQAIQAALVARDLRAILDPSNLQPPCVVISPGGMAFDHLDESCVTYKFTLYAVAPGVRIADSLPVLDELVTRIREVVEINEVEPGSIPYGEGELPAYQMSVEIDGEW
jgi:hypothetical protein